MLTSTTVKDTKIAEFEDKQPIVCVEQPEQEETESRGCCSACCASCCTILLLPDEETYVERRLEGKYGRACVCCLLDCVGGMIGYTIGRIVALFIVLLFLGGAFALMSIFVRIFWD